MKDSLKSNGGRLIYFIKFIGFDRIIDGVSHIFDARLVSSSSRFSWLLLFDRFEVEFGESVTDVTDGWVIRGYQMINNFSLLSRV